MIRSVEVDCLQFVARHAEEVVIDIAECRRPGEGAPEFKEFLWSAPDFDALEIERPTESARLIDLGEGA
jgi:hypothetical protein